LDKHFDSWAAGFWEGEGSIIKDKNKNGFRISLCQSFHDKRNVENIMIMLKDTYGGTIIKQSFNNHYHDILMWRILKGKDVINFIKRIFPYCQFRKKELQNVLNVYEQHPEHFTRFKIIDIKKARELRKSGLTYRKIGKILNEYPSVIFKHLNYYEKYYDNQEEEIPF